MGPDAEGIAGGIADATTTLIGRPIVSFRL
jgi:hypothetical protein